jgi:hypothetical protein
VLGRRLQLVPFVLIWGRNDPYLHVFSAEFLRSQLRHGAGPCAGSGTLAADRRRRGDCTDHAGVVSGMKTVIRVGLAVVFMGVTMTNKRTHSQPASRRRSRGAWP